MSPGEGGLGLSSPYSRPKGFLTLTVNRCSSSPFSPRGHAASSYGQKGAPGFFRPLSYYGGYGAQGAVLLRRSTAAPGARGRGTGCRCTYAGVQQPWPGDGLLVTLLRAKDRGQATTLRRRKGRKGLNRGFLSVARSTSCPRTEESRRKVAPVPPGDKATHDLRDIRLSPGGSAIHALRSTDARRATGRGFCPPP